MNCRDDKKFLNPARRSAWLFAGWLLAGLAGCQTMEPKQATALDGIYSAIDEGIEVAAKPQPQPVPQSVPDDVAMALLPQVVLSDVQQEANRFDVSVINAPAREFFMTLVEGTSTNMVVHPSVTGEISLTLKNVSVADVMETVRELYGYDYKPVSNGYLVLPVELKTRVFPVNFLNVTRTGASKTRVSSGQISAAAGGEDGESESSAGSNSTLSGSMVETRSNSDLWKELESGLTAIVGTEAGRMVVVNQQTGTVIVRAFPEELRAVGRFLVDIQERVGRQVIIEAKILEVELNDGYQSGINWAALIEANGKSITLGQSGSGLAGGGESDIGGQTGNLDPDDLDPVTGTLASAFGGVFSASIDLGDFTAFIELLETQGNVQVLSTPRISTTNNQKAVIKIGSDEYFVTDISNTITGGGSDAIQTPDIELTPFFSGIALDVTPQIDDVDGVTLHIHPSITDVTEKTKILDIGENVTSLPLAFSKVRESDSIIYARNGQVVVLGGLMQDITGEDLASSPWLSDIPFFGSTFRHTKQVSKKSELVILLRPIVVEGPDTWADALVKQNERFRSLDRGFHYGSKTDVFGTMGETR